MRREGAIRPRRSGSAPGGARVVAAVLALCVAGCERSQRIGDPCTDACDGPNLACGRVHGGPNLCMERCEDPSRPCFDGSVCGNYGVQPEAPTVCYLGGPLAEGQPCSATEQCGHGLVCNLAHGGVCEPVCDPKTESWTERTEHSCASELRCAGPPGWCLHGCWTTADCPEGMLCLGRAEPSFNFCARAEYAADCDGDGTPECEPGMVCTFGRRCRPPL